MAEGVAEGELVDRLGGVLPEDDRRRPGVGADEACDRGVRFLVRGGAETRLEARSTVDARVVREKAVHGLDARCGRRRVVAALSRLM